MPQLGGVGAADVAAADDADPTARRVRHHARPRECPWSTRYRTLDRNASIMSVAQRSSSTMCHSAADPAAIAPATSTRPEPTATCGASRSAGIGGAVLDMEQPDPRPERCDERGRVHAAHGRPVDVHLRDQLGTGELEQALEAGRPGAHPGPLARTRGCDSPAGCRARLRAPGHRQLVRQRGDALARREPIRLHPGHDDRVHAQLGGLIEDPLALGPGWHPAVDAHPREAQVLGPAAHVSGCVVVERGVLDPQEASVRRPARGHPAGRSAAVSRSE